MGDLTKLIARVEALAGPDRSILDKLDRGGNCWLWMGKLDARRRGRVWRNGKLMLHHRAVWEILVGPIPDGALLCHHCDNPRCANPTHLYVGNSKSNVDDMFRRHRHWTQVDPDRARRVGARSGKKNFWFRGEDNPRAKLTLAQIAVIKDSDVGPRALAREYNVHRTTIQRIRKGALWNG